MKKAQSVGLIGTGSLTDSTLTRFRWLSERLGPVKSASYRVASRIANMLRAGHPVKDYVEFESCELILICVPEETVPHIVSDMLSSGVSWRGKAVVLCSTWLDSGDLRELSTRGASVGSISAIPGFDGERYLVEGDPIAIRQSKLLLEHRDRRVISIDRPLKPCYLAALTCTGSLLFALLHVAFESLRCAGSPPGLSAGLLERQVARTLRSFLKAGRRAYPEPREIPRHCAHSRAPPRNWRTTWNKAAGWLLDSWRRGDPFDNLTPVSKRNEMEGRLAPIGVALANWSERWFPDPLVFALAGIVVVFLIGVAAGETPTNLAIQGGKSFWSLIPFTMQMVMIIIGGYVVASTPLVQRATARLADIPKTPRQAITLVALFSTLTALLSWGMSPIISALLVRQLSRRIKGLDYRAAGAAAFLGGGTVWALGISSSAAMLMATKSAMPAKLYAISGLIPLTSTIFLWPSLLMTAVLIIAGVLVAYLSAPAAAHARTAESYGLRWEPFQLDLEPRTKPGEWLEYNPLLTISAGALLCVYLIDLFRTSPQGALSALDLNTFNLIFLTAGLLLQWRPKRFLRAVMECVPGTAGVIIQFPLYAVIFGMIVGTGLSDKAARLLTSISTHNTFALLVALYSATLGVFIPSGGSKWIIEAPYVLQAAIEHHVNLGWVVQIYNASEALPNMINPFFMLPLLGILRLRARDLVGYGLLQLMVQAPIVFFLCWFFARQLPFVPPMR